MKTVKQMTALFFAIVLALSLAACGGSETTVVLRGDVSAETGVPTTDTWTLTAKGDIVQKVQEVYEMDLSDFDEEMIDLAVSMFDSLVLEPAKGIEGVECTSKMEGTTYIITLTVDCTGSAVKEAAKAGILTVDGDADAISLKQTQTSLEQQGYKVVE